MNGRNLKQLVGFILFWIAVGMLFMLFISSCFVGILIAVAFMLLGYNLYCGHL